MAKAREHLVGHNPWSTYQRASSDRICRTIWLASGEVGTGKTRFGLTGPQPVFVQSLDKGLEGVVEDLAADKEVYFKEYDWAPVEGEEFSQQQAIELREAILTDFNHALQHARTIIWDKESDIREVFQYAEFGSPMGNNIKDYAKLNQRYFNLINHVKSVPNVNFGLIQAMKDEWVVGDSGKVDQNTGQKKKSFNKSGRRIRSGYDRLDELVMLELHFRREAGEFFIDIGKCRQNAQLMDQTIPAMAFSEFGQLLLPNTSAEDWQ